ncbi:MAG: GspH/FimT family pseudopilin [Wenzhouxiangellaceae bacterium]|nr:GspH/FimT family pseudopilin [Wenzhouxiangellaceae bacterium]
MRKQLGFTIMELMIAIVVLAILTTLAVPSFRTFVQNNRLAAQANEMVATFQLARSEALKRGYNVQVCSSNNGATCGGGWKDGWIAIADPGGANEELLRVWPTPGNDFEFSPTAGTVGFEAKGFSSSAAQQQFNVTLEGCSTDNARNVLIERTGRVASERVDCPT